MKLLLDQNISYRLAKKVKLHFPECMHVSDCRMENEEDPDIWNYAGNHDFAIVTFDSDFYDLSIINGAPPKVIWLRTGNLTTNELAKVMINNRDRIEAFLRNKAMTNRTCLEIK